MEKEKIIAVDCFNIYEQLDLIRRRPQVFLTSKSVTALQNYITGYLVYARRGYSEQMYNEKDPDFNAFRWWLIDGVPKINMSSGPVFFRELLDRCDGNEELAFDLFFEKLEEFKSLQSKD